jgi:hypothetical protein
MERRLGNDPAVTYVDGHMTKLARAITSAALLAALSIGASRAQDLSVRPLRYGYTSGWYYDNRDDNRDFTTNGFFPGNFSADPPSTWLGAAGALAGNSYRSPLPYTSQVVIGPSPCVRRDGSHARGFVGPDGIRHRC